MHIIASFEPSAYVEMAILALERDGIDRSRIAAVPLKPGSANKALLHAVQRGSGNDAFDAAAVLGTICSVLSASFGFELRWGPILWGLIGLAAGAGTGFLLHRLFSKSKTDTKPRENASVVLIVRCEPNESGMISGIMQQFSAGGIGMLQEQEP